jgi:DNA-binding MurR/RpiR family transcriptional regulator
MGFTKLPTEFFAKKLQSLGKNSFYFSDRQLMLNSIENNESDTIYIFLSISGDTNELVEAANMLNKMNMKNNSYLISLNPESKLSLLIPNVQIAYKEKTILPDKDLQSRIQIDVVCRIILDYFVLLYLNKNK